MSEDELLDMDYFLNDDNLDDVFEEDCFFLFLKHMQNKAPRSCIHKLAITYNY